MGKETQRMARQVEKAFDKQPWYGSSVMKILSGIDPAIVTRQHGNTNSIIALVLHMASWRTFVTKRLQGDNDFEVSEENNFPKPGAWKDALAALAETQAALLKAIQNFPDERLDELVPSKTMKYTYYTLIHGIVQHDVYHLGQIAYISKSLEE